MYTVSHTPFGIVPLGMTRLPEKRDSLLARRAHLRPKIILDDTLKLHPQSASVYAPHGATRSAGKHAFVRARQWVSCAFHEMAVATSDNSSLVESLINKIPVEVLCKIFSETLASSPPSGASHIGLHRKNMELLKLTAVCKHWRSTSSECAILWTRIVFSTSLPSTIQCAMLFLGRSKEAMLSVHICDSDHRSYPEVERSRKEILELIAIQSHRLSSCDFSSPSLDFWSHWSFPAPNLRELTVQGHGTGMSPIFRGQLPRLESLTSLYYAPWPLGNYIALREADLRNHGQNVTLITLLDALRGCEVLEKLTLHGYGRLDSGTPSPAIVPLPRLGRIDLFSSDSALILEHLETPSLIGPVIIFDSSPDHDILHSIPKTQRTRPYLQGIARLHVVLNSYSTQYYIAGYREDGSIALYIGVCGVGHWFRWTWARASIRAIASFVHFSNVLSLIFSTDSPVVPWDLWLPNLDNLRELTVSSPRSEGLLVSLLGASPENGLPLCPSLQSLALYRCGRCTVVDHMSLMAFVMSRYQIGRPLRTLKLHKDEWEWIQQLDNSWVALTRSQSAYFGQRYA